MAASYTYWISTALLSLLYLTSATLYMVKADWARQALVDLHYPGYLVRVLAAVKILAVVAIVSRVSVPLSDLAYAGVLYHLLFSGIAHIGVRKLKDALPAAVGLVLLVASFTTQNAARETASPYGAAVAAHQ
ncbi:MAG TPA: DoxX family protein [Burkholderiaceae bacterium]|nr:DoxX family protein [Burkholderiaceae bacterium]